MRTQLHNVEDAWLRNRILPWLFSETAGKFWAVFPDKEGRPVYVTYRQGYEPSTERKQFAFDVCKYINRNNGCGGVWLAGYIDKDIDQEFYLLWRDPDGDIQIPIEFPQQFRELREKWGMDDFLFQSDMAMVQWKEHMANLELKPEQIGSLARI